MQGLLMAFFSAMLLPAAASAATSLSNQTVREVGSHANSSTAFFYLQDDRPECKWGAVYIDLSSEGGRAAYATVLSAKQAGTAIRVSYAFQADGTCLADLVAG